MALDKLVDSTQLDSDLTSVANAIRAKSGGSSQLAFPAGFVSEIQAIPSGGGAEYGIKDVTYTPTDATWSATVSSNRFSNVTLVNNTKKLFAFSKNVFVEGGDVLELDIKKISGKLNWCDLRLYAAPVEFVQVASNINPNNATPKQTYSYTVPSDGLTRELFAFGIFARNGAWTNASFDVELRLNGTTLFSSF